MDSAVLLRLALDLLILTGAAPDLAAAKRLVERKVREYVAEDPTIAAASPVSAAAPAVCPSCPFRDPARIAAFDGLAGAFLQVGEHFELLAEPPRAITYAANSEGAVAA